ncbi:hypothetical protein, partial [Pseudomonas proteolytica]|uniref:hypothetical protein n=1 Tax=Pseudomonas proteolytica TaxID=219574 RepID=UPI001B868786
AAKQPQNQPLRCIWYNAFGLLGLLRSPARGKPARHNCAICLDLGVAAKLCKYLWLSQASQLPQLIGGMATIPSFADIPLWEQDQWFM